MWLLSIFLFSFLTLSNSWGSCPEQNKNITELRACMKIADNQISLFCENSEKFICDGKEFQVIDKKLKRDEIFNAAFKKSKPKFKSKKWKKPKSFEEAGDFAYGEGFFNEQTDMELITHEMEQIASNELAETHSKYKGEFEKIKKILQQKIDSKTSISPELKLKMKQKVSLVDLSEAPEDKENCCSGYDFSYLDKACFLPSGNGKLVICSGTIELAKKNPDLIAGIVSHELGHSIHFMEFPSAYDSVKECLESLSKTSKRQLEELTADLWATEVLTVKLKSQNVDHTLQTLKSNLQPYCGDQIPGNEHPGQDIRLPLFSNNSEIRSVLKCQSQTTQKSCEIK